jgi:hypothetical protein
MSLIAQTSRPEPSLNETTRVEAPSSTKKLTSKPPAPSQHMKQRVVRYLFVYVSLVMVLTGVRFMTSKYARQLADLQTQSSLLERQSAQLHRDISSLESPARVRAWAEAHGMVPYVSGSFNFVKLDSLPGVADVPKPKNKVTVETQWR